MKACSAFQLAGACLSFVVVAFGGGARAQSAGVEIPDARAIFEARPAPRPGLVPEAVPPRFVLMEDRRVFVGGLAGLAAGVLEKDEDKALRKRFKELRRMPGLGGTVTLGPGEQRFRLRVADEKLDIVATGDPARAPVELRLLASLVADLAQFNHASLQPLPPAQYLASAQEAALAGGCREWNSWPTIGEIAAGPRVIPAETVAGWPTGAIAAAVCERGKRYALTLRPLLPNERR